MSKSDIRKVLLQRPLDGMRIITHHQSRSYKINSFDANNFWRESLIFGGGRHWTWTYLNVWIAAIAFRINGGQISTLSDVNLERALFVIILHSEFHLPFDSYRTISAFTRSRVNACHRIGTKLCGNQQIRNLEQLESINGFKHQTYS